VGHAVNKRSRINSQIEARLEIDTPEALAFEISYTACASSMWTKIMSSVEQFDEIIKRYQTHGWRLARALLCAETRARLNLPETPLADVSVEESLIDALWFARASHEGREAWELRLVADTPYALFETFEADEMEEDREEVRREMEARMRDYATRS
jgi:hypothetical protein